TDGASARTTSSTTSATSLTPVVEPLALLEKNLQERWRAGTTISSSSSCRPLWIRFQVQPVRKVLTLAKKADKFPFSYLHRNDPSQFEESMSSAASSSRVAFNSSHGEQEVQIDRDTRERELLQLQALHGNRVFSASVEQQQLRARNSNDEKKENIKDG
ncbi:unnamed protein product, partial [Amoebophrya sp. A120]